jgi:hypothetical protein
MNAFPAWKNPNNVYIVPDPLVTLVLLHIVSYISNEEKTTSYYDKRNISMVIL